MPFISFSSLIAVGSNGETDTENRLMDMGRGEEGVSCMERVTWTCTLPLVK